MAKPPDLACGGLLHGVSVLSKLGLWSFGSYWESVVQSTTIWASIGRGTAPEPSAMS